MRDMFRAIRRIVEEFTDVKVIYPVHLNPQVRKIADEEFGGCERIHLIEPLDVVEFHNLMKASYLIMTDSGGIRKKHLHLENLYWSCVIQQNVRKVWKQEP